MHTLTLCHLYRYEVMMGIANEPRKQHRLRVNIPLAIALEDVRLIEEAYAITGESRNAFCVNAAIARARAIVDEHAKREDAA